MAKDWLNELSNTSLRAVVTTSFSDDEFTYSETLDFLEKAAVGGFSSSELEDLRLVYQQHAFEDNYVDYITHKVIYDSPANTYWWGGATKQADVQTLGNASGTTSELNAERIIGKWFLGTDLPMPISGGDTANPDASSGVYDYGKITGELFTGGINALDVNQGSAGTCYLIAAMDSTAYTNPSIIEDAFVINPNGTYGVTFYSGGETIYTTVNKSIPVTDWGAINYTGNVTKSLSGESWASMMEKAYLQANTQVNLKADASWSNSKISNSYLFMEGGLAYALGQVTGLSYDYFSYGNYNWGSDYNKLTSEKDASKIKQDIIDGLDAGGIGWIASWGSSYRKDGEIYTSEKSGSKTELVGGHAFALHSYDKATDTFLISNPWTESSAGSYYNTTFSLGIEDFWTDHFSPLIAITSPTAARKDLNFSISTAASSVEGAALEDSKVTFTITRDGTGQADTVYVSTAHETTSNGDIVELNKNAVTFGREETVKTIEVSILADGLAEETEAFQLNLFKSQTSSTPDATIDAYVNNVSNGSFSYTISSNGSTSDAAINEGTDLNLTITRDGSGSASTVYLSSSNVTTSNGDLAQLSYKPIQFSAKETVKTVTITTYEDTTTEGTEALKLHLYDGPAQTEPVTSGDVYITDNWSPDYNYLVYSSAGTEETAANEGDTITFNVMRMGSGSSSTVNLKSFFNNASSNDLVSSGDIELNFSANETMETFDVVATEDLWLETTESFGYRLYTSETSTNAEAEGLAYIKDKLFKDYEYTLSADNSGSFTVDEGNNFTLNITRDGSGNASEVYISTRHGPTNAADFESVSKQKVTFTQKDTLKSVVIQTYGDSLTDGGEFFYVELYLNENDINPAYSKKVDLNDVQQTGNFSYTVSDTTVNEGEDAVFTITRDNTGEASTVWVNTYAETADENDYAALELTNVTFSKKETTKTITVKTYEDAEIEGSTPEFFWLDLYKDKSDYQTGEYHAYGYADIVDTTSESDKSYTYTVSNQTGNTVTEGGTTTFTITRDSSGTASTVYINTMDGTADSNDYKALATTAVEFNAKETTKTVSVEAYTDNEAEDSEYFYVVLYDSTENASAGNYLTYDYSYIENVTASVSYTYSVEDVSVTEGETATFTITRDSSSTASSVFVNTSEWDATSGSDFETLTGSEIAFAAGETSKTVSVATYTDSITESDEYYYLDLFASYADALDGFDYISYGNGTIVDGGTASVSYTYSVEDVSVTEGETATFTITRDSSSSASSVFVNTSEWDATLGSDFATLTGKEIAFAAGETSKTVSVATYTDSITESDEYYYLDLFASYEDAKGGSDYVSWAWGTIADATVNETYSYTANSPTVTEGETAMITVTKSGGSAAASTVYMTTYPYNSIVEDTDYQGLTAKVVTFAAGETTQTVTIDTYSDSYVDGTEYFYTYLYKVKADAEAANANIEGSEADAAYVTLNVGTSSGGGYSGENSGSQANGVNTFYGHDGSQFQNAYAFAAIKSDGSLDAWGNSSNGGDEAAVKSKLTDVSSVFSNHKAFAAVKSDGSVVTWGDQDTGGNSSTVSEKLNGSIDVASISSTKSAFAALREDGSVVTWGSPGAGGDNSALEQRTDIKAIYSNTNAFAALSNSGDIITWGQENFGGQSSDISFDAAKPFTQVYSTSSAFAALRDDGSVVTWGNKNDGGNSTSVASKLDGRTDVSSVSATTSAFAALLQDGSVVTWGNFVSGANSSAVAGKLDGTIKVTKIFSNDFAFAALRADGSVVTWGSSALGGDSSAVAANLTGRNNVTDIYSNSTSFVAIHEDSTITTWGFSQYGGDSSSVASQIDGTKTIKTVAASQKAYSVLLEDGAFVSWGDFGDDTSSRIEKLITDNTDITTLSANSSAFYALDNEANTIAWGNTQYGGSYSEDTATTVTLSSAIVTGSSKALSDVNIAISTDAASNTYTSASDGSASASLTSGDTVTVTANLDYSNTSKAVTSQDALDALKLSVGLTTSAGTKTAFEYLAADFNQDGKVSSQDALSILKYSVGLTTPEQAKWIFLNTDGDYSGVSKSNTSYTEGVTIADLSADTSVSLTGVLIGDVNDSFIA